MRISGNYQELLDGFEALNRSMKRRRASLLTTVRAGVPVEHDAVYFDDLNQSHCADLERLEDSLQRARQRFSPLARVLVSEKPCARLNFSRSFLRGALKLLGFDACARANAVEVAELKVANIRLQIQQEGMRPERMHPKEFEALALQAGERCRIAASEFTAAREEVSTIDIGLERLKSLGGAVKARTAALHGLTFSSGYRASTRLLLEYAEKGEFRLAFQLLDSVPVRIQPSERGRSELRKQAAEVVERWSEKGLYNLDANTLVASGCVDALDAVQIAGPRASRFADIRTVVSKVGTLEFDLQNALYWIGSAAEHSILERVPRIAKEEFYNAGLVTEVENVAEKMGRKLFHSLGYTYGFPFELAFWETDPREDEADTGADMCIIVHIVLEDNSRITRGALLQGKRARGLAANIHRSSTRLGRNHQLISLTSGEALGYYLFYHHPFETLGVSVVPADIVKATIVARSMPTVKLWEILPANCLVATDKNATDFASFLAFTLMDPKHRFTSIGDALLKMGKGRTGYENEAGEGVVEELASKLAIITIGGAMPAVDLEILTKFGFKETDRHKRLTPGFSW